MAMSEYRQEREKNLTDVKAWAHYYAPEPLKAKLKTVIEDAELLQQVMSAVNKDSLASDGWEMIEAALRNHKDL